MNFRRAETCALEKVAGRDRGKTDIGAEGMNQRGDHLSGCAATDQRRVGHVVTIT